MHCNYVTSHYAGDIQLESLDINTFKAQYRKALESTKGTNGVVYVFYTRNNICRLDGESNILYIGETKNDVWSRYSVESDVEMFWHVYEYVIHNYGPIKIDVYQSSDHEATERNFLNQYYESHKELPPMNRKG